MATFWPPSGFVLMGALGAAGCCTRSAGAEAALKEAGVLTEAEAGPFAALAKLKRGDSDQT